MVYLLAIYRTFPHTDLILIQFAEAKLAKNNQDYSTAVSLYRDILAKRPELTPVRIELAMALFLDRQNKAAQAEIDQVLKVQDLPKDINKFVRLYQEALQKRDSWQFDVGANYLRDENINHVSDSYYIENTALAKGSSMLPKTGHGLSYYVGISRDLNLWNNHYLHFANSLYGKNYWDNHDYDDIVNRTYLGYTNQSATQRWALLPFYERQWYGNHRYKWAQGVRLEYNRRLGKNWQISTALEYAKQKYHQNFRLNGNSKLASATLFWQRNPQQFFYLGGDLRRETATRKDYSYDLALVRTGWGQDWQFWQLSSRLGLSFGRKAYKADFILGNSVYFNHKRTDKIYTVNATLWKRNWHILSITPKLNFTWKKQDSNYSSIYSYTDRNINVLFEKAF